MQKPPAYSLFFTARFFTAGGLVVAAFVLSWLLGIAIDVPQALTAVFALLVLAELLALYAVRPGVQGHRVLADRLSNGDNNPIQVVLQSHYPYPVQLTLVEELPMQLQARHNSYRLRLAAGEQHTFTYPLRPVERGVYHFGYCLLYISTRLGWVQRRMAIDQPREAKVYPSYIQLKKYSLKAGATRQAEAGQKKMRKVGHSLEFEQIKEYVPGDDIRQLNWKATARRGSLMLNHYMDERSQQVYVLLDKGRLMKMPFHGLSMLDYAINSTLVLANVCLQKQDRFGLITFSHEPGTLLAAQRNPLHMNRVLEALYKQETAFLEPNYEKLYLQVRSQIKHRSLLILFTQFESMGGLKRQLPYLQQMAKHHLLLVVFFENTELTALAAQPVDHLEGIYTKTIAEKFYHEKKMIVKELNRHGILTILCPPEQLTLHTVNKYLELKNRQAI